MPTKKNPLNLDDDLRYETLFNTLDSEEEGWAVVLQSTAKLNKGQLPKLESLYERSHEGSSPLNRYICTFLNSVLYHKRFFFILHAKTFFAMVRADKNHPPKLRTFNDRLWKKFIAVLIQNGIVTIREESGEKFMEITDEWVKNQLVLELSQDEIKKIHDTQRQQTVDFIKNKSVLGTPVEEVDDDYKFDATSEAVYYNEKELLEQVEIWRRRGNNKNADALMNEYRRGNYKRQ